MAIKVNKHTLFTEFSVKYVYINFSINIWEKSKSEFKKVYRLGIYISDCMIYCTRNVQ